MHLITDVLQRLTMHWLTIDGQEDVSLLNASIACAAQSLNLQEGRNSSKL